MGRALEKLIRAVRGGNASAEHDLVESLRTEPDDPRDRAYYLADKQDYYEMYIALLIELHDNDSTAGYAARALEVSERRRARTLLDVLNASLVDQVMEIALRRPSPESQPAELDERESPGQARPTVAERLKYEAAAFELPATARSSLWPNLRPAAAPAGDLHRR